VEYIRAGLLEKHDRFYQESQFAGNWLMGQFVPVANAAFEQANGGEGFDLVEVTDWPLLFIPWVAQRHAMVPFTISLHSSVGQMVEYEAKRDGGWLDFALVRMFEALGFAAAQSIHANGNLNARYWEKITNRKVDVLLPLMGKVGLTTDGTDIHGYQKRAQGNAQGASAGAAFPNPSTSELARDSENTSLTRSASGPAVALRSDIGELGGAEGNQLADSAGFLEGRSQAGLQMENQKSCNIRFANDPGASGENSSSVIIRDIRGQKTSEVPKALALDSRLRLRGAVFARLQNWKGCEILAEALAECPSIEVHWYGADMGNTTQGGKWSESLARKFPKVFGQNFLYKGVVEPARVPDLMAQADFVCVPSLWDVFNLSAVETMESGKVVLCSRQAGAEMLIENGVNGFLFEPDQPGDLAEKLKQIVQMLPEERERIGRVACESVREKLHPERLVQQRIAYYQSVAAKKPEENRNCFLPDILELKPSGKKTLGRRLYEFRRKIGI
jgi:glycosyltransferase involved in cell wall biosynthesis